MKIDGIILLDKPSGFSSNQVLQKVKRYLKADKAGHTGSLDPMATGMLPLCFGQATKLCEYLLASDKCYQARIQLGVGTDTGDADGDIIEQTPVPALSQEKVSLILNQFLGDIKQVPPMYSALKKDGVPLYQLARQGIDVERKARRIHIHQLVLLALGQDWLELQVVCSKGTYIRRLAEDIGQALHCAAHLTMLRRLYCSGFQSEYMLTLDQVTQASDPAIHLLPIDAGLMKWPSYSITAEQRQQLHHGKRVELLEQLSGDYRLYCQQQLVAIAVVKNGIIVQRKLFH